MSAGIGKNAATTTVKTEEVTGKKKKKRGPTSKSKKQVKSTKMKQTAIRAKKTKTIKKKKGIQLRTIRVSGAIDQDDLMPKKGDPGVKGESNNLLFNCRVHLFRDETH